MKHHPHRFYVAFAIAAVAFIKAFVDLVVPILAPAANYVAPALTAIAVTVAVVIVAFGILRFAQTISISNVLAKVRMLAFRDDFRASAIG